MKHRTSPRPIAQPKVEHLDRQQPGEIELPAAATEREAKIDDLARQEVKP